MALVQSNCWKVMEPILRKEWDDYCESARKLSESWEKWDGAWFDWQKPRIACPFLEELKGS